MAASDLANRAQGALLGAFIGEALGVGPHWYYDLDQLHADFGPWIDGYTAPLPGRYHAGLHAGDSSQPGFLLELTLRSLVDCGGYDQADFCRRIDADFFPLLDGTPHAGPGGYTSQSMREAWRKRVQQGLPWGRVGGLTDNTEAAERTLAIAVREAGDLGAVARHVAANAALTQVDPTVLAMTTAYGCVLALLVQGEPLDAAISAKLLAKVHRDELPFHHVTDSALDAVPTGAERAAQPGDFASPDALLTAGSIARAARDADVRIDPAWKVSLVYGMPCAVYHQFPAAYYLAARFADDLERAVLHAINGGGQNQARAMLTGALVGAQVGLSGIPQRFIDGLSCAPRVLPLSARLAEQSTRARKEMPRVP